jgi:hypothetical protein
MRERARGDGRSYVLYPCPTFLALFTGRGSPFHLGLLRGNVSTTSGWPFASRITAWRYAPRSNGPEDAHYVAHRLRRPVWVKVGGRRKKGEEEETRKDREAHGVD